MNGYKMLRRFCLLALFAGLAFLVPVFAQSYACPAVVSVQTEQLPETKVIVDQVEFLGEIPLTESQRADLSKEIQSHSFVVASGGSQDDWAIEVNEVIVRGMMQDLGYFKVSPHSTSYLIRATDSELHYALRIEIESGPQYRLGDVRFTSTRDTPPAFSEDVLRQQLELKKGDLFNVSKVRKAIENIMRMYNTKGYLDMVPEPETWIDDKTSLIDVTFNLDEGKAYRISGIDVVGGQSEATKPFLLPQTKGDLVDNTLWVKFFEDNRARFPVGAAYESSVRLTRDVRDSSTRITVDFQACPEPRPQVGPVPILRTKSEL